eukprot:11758863-Alexandrium_andersonii.AAC.1
MSTVVLTDPGPNYADISRVGATCEPNGREYHLCQCFARESDLKRRNTAPNHAFQAHSAHIQLVSSGTCRTQAVDNTPGTEMHDNTHQSP